MLKKCVGLFGTCGDSKWRDEVIPILTAANVDYFNPVVPEWNDEAQRNEVEHAASDHVILLVITGETTGIASMAESGWIALNCATTGQKLIVVLDDMPNDVKDEFGVSLRLNKARALLRKYIRSSDNDQSSLFLMETVQDAALKAVELLGVA